MQISDCTGGWMLLTPVSFKGQLHIIFSKECNQSRRESEMAAAVQMKVKCLTECQAV